MIRLLLVDDQQLVRHGLRLRLHLEPDIQIVGEAGSGKEALLLAQTLTPDVVLMDVEMPDMDGIQTTIALQALALQSVVIILSLHEDKHTRERAQAAGATAFVEKRGAAEQLLLAIRQAAQEVEHYGLSERKEC